MRLVRIYQIALFLVFSFGGLHIPVVQAQTAHKDLRSADKAYDKESYESAENLYRDAVIKQPSAKAKFNLGNTLFEQERYEEAAEEYQQAINLSNDTFFRAKALYNKGNSLYKNGDLEESLKAYKRSLLMNPADEDAKRNFMLALQEQQLQQQQQQQQEQEQEQEENENQEQQQEQNDSPSPQEEEENDEEQPQEQEQNQQEEEQPQEQQQEQEMNREVAEQLLQIIENADSYVQKKLKKQNSNKKQGEKDW